MAEHDKARPAELGLHLLVLRCQAGDEQAFRKLLSEYGPRTLRYLRGVLGDSAEDVQQEVWLTVYQSIAGLANPRAFRTWLYRCTRHRALDFLRGRHREQELLEDFARKETGEPPPAAADAPTLSEELLGALDALPPAQREVCLLRYRDELSYGEIALVLSCSVGTVRSRLHYAKERLRELVSRPLTPNP
jgi:RNA polymerase sigma-70 factor (ECF subfamily)